MVLRQRSGQVHRPGPAGKEGTRELRWVVGLLDHLFLSHSRGDGCPATFVRVDSSLVLGEISIWGMAGSATGPAFLYEGFVRLQIKKHGLGSNSPDALIHLLVHMSLVFVWCAKIVGIGFVYRQFKEFQFIQNCV
ncbi:hypothetical protein SDJN02_15111, partial [Cucurbita argyrosperma subsp. argyrosperma]